MAKCPKCEYNLKPWNVRAECPECGVNIPNYNWEERLEEDAVHAEAAFAVFRRRTGNMKSALFGNPLRIARFVLTFFPLLSLLFPIVKVAVSLPYIAKESSVSVLNIILNFSKWFDFGAIFGMAKGDITGPAASLFLAALGLIVLAILLGVLNFALLIINSIGLKYRSNIVLCILSALCFVASAVLMNQIFSAVAATSVQFISGGVGYAYYIGTALFLVNAAMNIIVGTTLKKEKAEQEASK